MNHALIIPGTIYKLAENGRAMDIIAEPSIDETAMSAAAIICTPAVDRANDRMDPTGGDYEDYKKNPVVLWEHGFDPNITVPIAKCENPDGSLALKAAAEGIEASAFFTNKVKESAQIFDLIVERIVRATSVHFLPVEWDQEAASTAGGMPITNHKRWKLLEWSWGRMGVNPEAVAKVLSRNRLAGDPICEAIAKTLRPFAPRAKGNGVGWTPPVTTPPSTPKAKTMTPEEEAVAAAAAAEAEKKTGDSDTEPVVDGDQTEQTPSVRVASAVKNALSQLVANVQAAANTYEDPRAKEYLEGAFLEQCNALMTEVDGLISELGGKAETPETHDEGEAEEAMKTFLAGGVRSRMQVLGFAAPLASLATAKNLKPEQRLAVEGVMKNLQKVVGQARASADGEKTKALATKVEEAKSTFDKAEKALAAATSMLKELAPA